MTAVEVLEQLRARGGRLDLEVARLRMKAPEGVDIADLKVAAKPVRGDLVDMLRGWRCWECGKDRSERRVMMVMAAPTKDGQESFVCSGCWKGEG